MYKIGKCIIENVDVSAKRIIKKNSSIEQTKIL